MRLSFLLVFVIAFLSQLIFAESEYTFNLDETEKKPYSLGGYLEARPVFLYFDKDASLYKLKLYDKDEGKTAEEYNTKLQLDGSYEKRITKIYTKINVDTQESYLGWSDTINIFEGYISLKPSSSLNINIGKKAMKWGKGYAWTPVAFFDRTKNPDDPDLALEGFISLSADYTKSYSGSLKTISFTPVLLPVYDNINDEFGETDKLNFGGKVYLLLYDTDIDFIMLAGGSKTKRFGFDFSRNITPNFEIHGEFAFVNNFEKKFINSTGNISVDEYDAESYLFGIRYLTKVDTTFIVEYYHNNTGFTDEEMQNYFSFINTAYKTYTSSGNDNNLQKALDLTEGNYGRMNPMRDYLYVRVSQKEPFNILYFTPSITGIVNINDKSFSVSPELLYTGVTNLGLRLKTTFLSGQSNSEYGEKYNDCRIELMARYYF